MVKEKLISAVHKCSQEENLKRMNVILVGNGHPEQGLAFIVKQTCNDMATIKEDIAEIKTDIKSLALMYDNTFNAAVTTQSALEKYKSEMEQYENGKKYVREYKNNNVLKVIQVVGAIIAFLAMASGMWFGFKAIQKNTADLSNKIEQLETTKQ